jgi:hypothetical protein
MKIESGLLSENGHDHPAHVPNASVEVHMLNEALPYLLAFKQQWLSDWSLRPVPKSLSLVAKSLNHLRPALLKSEKIR